MKRCLLALFVVAASSCGDGRVRIPYTDAPPRLQPVVAACLAVEKTGVVVYYAPANGEFTMVCLL